MGCCLSTEEGKNRAAQEQSASLHKHHQQFPSISKSPPSPDVETVKEVLSETPKPWPEPEPEPTFKITKDEEDDPFSEKVNPEQEQEQEPTKSKLVVTPKKKSTLKENKKHQNGPGSPDRASTGPVYTTPEEISDVVSEMCSLSESISTSTLREKDEDEHSQQWSKDSAGTGEVRQRAYKSQGHNGNFNPQKSRPAFSGGRSPARRADPSPPRRRNPSPVSGPGLARRAQGEKSGRRSMSPAATRANVGRSPSGRRSGPSPGRVRMVQGPESRKMEEEERREKGNESESEWQGPSESLENPLVSLECFIFL